MISFIEPAYNLRKYIKSFCIVGFDNPTDFLPFKRVFPTGNICLVFHYGLPSKFKKDSNEYTEPNFVICGQQTGYYDLSLAGKTGMILILFRAQGFQAFFNLPACELLNENVSFSDIMNNEAAILEDKLSCAPNKPTKNRPA